MIIKKLQANNVLKYARLELSNLPAKGLIAITGPNEAGKTAIVETMCFALFGRTFSRRPEDIVKIIRWGESSCSVELEFTGNDEKSYTVRRSLDTKGVHAAQLYRSGEKKPFAMGPHTVAGAIVNVCGFDYLQYLDALYLAQMEISAPHSQSATIRAIAGARELEAVVDELDDEIRQEEQYITTIESEIGSLRQQIEALGIGEDTIATLEAEKSQAQEQIGHHRHAIAALENASTGIQTAGKELQTVANSLASAGFTTSLAKWRDHGNQLAESVRKIQEVCAGIETKSELCPGDRLQDLLGAFQDRLSAFDAVREPINRYRAQLAGLLNEASANPDLSSDEAPLPKQREALSRRLTHGRLGRAIVQASLLLAVVLTVMGWAGWWLLTQAPDWEYAEYSAAWLKDNLRGWNDRYIPWIQPTAGAATLIALILLLKARRLKSQVKRMRHELAQINHRLADARGRARFLDSMENIPFPKAVERLRDLDDEPINKALQAFVEDPGTVFLSAESLADHQGRWIELLAQCANAIGDLRESIATKIGRLNRLIEEEHERMARLEEAVALDRARREKAQALEQSIEETTPRIDPPKERIRLRQRARTLARNTCKHIYEKFNRVLITYSGDVMPKLTQGRYQQVQIADDLHVRVFSNEKNDFAELDEFSSGTQRQILLAVRLAMSKALIEATEQRQQFIILDEPFAFFDRERIRNTLKALPEIDKDMAQIWVISQEFEFRDQFKLCVYCVREDDTLIAAG